MFTRQHLSWGHLLLITVMVERDSRPAGSVVSVLQTYTLNVYCLSRYILIKTDIYYIMYIMS